PGTPSAFAFSLEHVIERRELVPFDSPAKSRNSAALTSPQGDKHLLLVKRCDLETNTNRYELLLFENGIIEKMAGDRQLPPRLLASFASSSNLDAIRAVTWLDEERVALIGEQPGATAQVYEIRLPSGRCRALTRQPTSIISFAINPRTGGVLLAAAVAA